jgi:hypothetical protein
VTGAGKKTWWYAGKVGETFTVYATPRPGFGYEVVDDERAVRFISESDCHEAWIVRIEGFNSAHDWYMKHLGDCFVVHIKPYISDAGLVYYRTVSDNKKIRCRHARIVN